MAGFTGYDDIINEVTTNDKHLRCLFTKEPSYGGPGAADIWYSFWREPGIPGAGAIPATTPGAAYTDADGSMHWANQTPDRKFFASVDTNFSSTGVLMVYDRLVGVGGIVLTSTGDKTVNSVALPRYSGTAADGVQAWLEVEVATTTTAPIVSLASYTNEAGTAGRAGGTIAFPLTTTKQQTFIGPLPLQSGDRGIRSVETINVNTASGGATATCSLVLLKPIAFFAGGAAIATAHTDFVLQRPIMRRVYDGASLAVAGYT